MTYFVCLTVPQKAISQLSNRFGRLIHFTNVTDTPFGRATCAENRERDAYILQVGSNSASLMNKKHKNNCPGLFVSVIETLLVEGGFPSVAFLGHTMSELIKTEKISVQDQKVIKLMDLAQSLSSSQEDIRYLVTR